ncbi:MAG: winged helix-turn-helix domain-containing protein [Nocardioidaceae bacterium]
MTRREFALLEYLMRHAGQVCSKDAILTEVWGLDRQRDPNVVEVYIGYLRRKVDTTFTTAFVHTVRGEGYMVDQRS